MHSRKDYRAIADVIRKQVESAAGDNQYHNTVVSVLHATARGIADHYGNENQKFDRSRFFSACGLTHHEE